MSSKREKGRHISLPTCINLSPFVGRTSLHPFFFLGHQRHQRHREREHPNGKEQSQKKNRNGKKLKYIYKKRFQQIYCIIFSLTGDKTFTGSQKPTNSLELERKSRKTIEWAWAQAGNITGSLGHTFDMMNR